MKRAAQRKLREEESQKWENVRKEIAERRLRDEDERRKFVDRVTQKKVLLSNFVHNSSFFK